MLKLKPILHGYTVESGLDQTKTDYVGFSAQNVQSVMPEAVGQSRDGMLSLSDRAILAAVVNAIKEIAHARSKGPWAGDDAYPVPGVKIDAFSE